MMIHNNSVLTIEKTIALPIVVETHAVLIDWNDELWIMINSVQNKETFIFKLNLSLSFDKIINLPLLSNSATICKNKLFIMGSNFEGKPVIISINNLGEIQNEINLEVTPTIWPVITFAHKIFIAWQENSTEIERGNLNIETTKIDKLPSISISNPPAMLFPLKKMILASFSEKNKVHLINLGSNEVSQLDISQQIAVGETSDSVFYGWLEKDNVCLKFLEKDKQVNFKIEKASLGNLKAVSGREATLWIQKQEMTIDDDYKWKSIIIQENIDPLEIEGFVYTVGSWGDRIVVVQNSEIILLKKQPIKSINS